MSGNSINFFESCFIHRFSALEPRGPTYEKTLCTLSPPSLRVTDGQAHMPIPVQGQAEASFFIGGNHSVLSKMNSIVLRIKRRLMQGLWSPGRKDVCSRYKLQSFLKNQILTGH